MYMYVQTTHPAMSTDAEGRRSVRTVMDYNSPIGRNRRQGCRKTKKSTWSTPPTDINMHPDGRFCHIPDRMTRFGTTFV